jgi:chromosome segregation ATPase
MPVYYTTADDIVDPIRDLDLKSASKADIEEERSDLETDIHDLEELISELRWHLSEAESRVLEIEEELFEREWAESDQSFAETEERAERKPASLESEEPAAPVDNSIVYLR